MIQQTETAWLAFQQLTVLQESVTLPPILVSNVSPIQTVQQDNSVIQLQIHASSAFLTPIAQPDFNVSLLKEYAELEPAQPTLTALYQVRSVMLLLENAKSDVPTIQTVLLMVSATSKAALVVCLRTTVREAYAQQTSTAPVALADLTANVSFDSLDYISIFPYEALYYEVRLI